MDLAHAIGCIAPTQAKALEWATTTTTRQQSMHQHLQQRVQAKRRFHRRPVILAKPEKHD